MLSCTTLPIDLHSRFNILKINGILDPLKDTNIVEENWAQLSEEGRPPTDEFLAKLGLVLGVSISWLLKGIGSPYPVVDFYDDETAAEYLSELLIEPSACYVISGGTEEFCIAHVVDTTWPVRGKRISSKSITLLSGNLGFHSRQLLLDVGDTHPASQVTISPNDFDSLKNGWLRLNL